MSEALLFYWLKSLLEDSMRSSFQFQLSCERVRMRAFRFFAVFSLLLIQQRTEGTYNGRLESTLELSDLITQDLLEKYSDVDAEDFWASNSLSFSSSPREGLSLSLSL